MKPPSVSRRALLGSAVGVGVVGAGVAVAITTDLDPSGSTAAWQSYRPIPAAQVTAGMAVAAHPSFRKSVYADVDAWMLLLRDLGISTFRGLYDPENPGCRQAVEACRRYGVRWVMLVVPEANTAPTNQDLATTAGVVTQVGRDAADVCAAIEGLNEPNHLRGGAFVADGWAEVAVAHQRVIWEIVQSTPALAGAVVIGPSLHDVTARASAGDPTASGGADHFAQLAAAGVGQWQDRLGIHSYPNAGTPLTGLAERIDLARSAFGDDLDLHITETGYTNALFQATNAAGTYEPDEKSRGPRPTSEEATAIYLRRAALELAALDLPWVCYELLDDPDPAPKDKAEAAFGLWRVDSPDPATWSLKPAGLGLRRLLDSLGSIGGEVRPRVVGTEPVRLRLDAPDDARVECILTAGADGALVAHLFRDVSVWDPELRRDLEVATVAVELTTDIGRWAADVGADVVSLPLR